MIIVNHREQAPVLVFLVVIKGILNQLFFNDFLNHINREFNALASEKLVGSLNALAPHIDVAHQRHGMPGVSRLRNFASCIFRTGQYQGIAQVKQHLRIGPALGLQLLPLCPCLVKVVLDDSTEHLGYCCIAAHRRRCQTRDGEKRNNGKEYLFHCESKSIFERQNY